MFLKKLNGLLLLVLLQSSVLIASDELKTIKLMADGPQVRVVEREWDYFLNIPCDQLEQLSAHSLAEQTFIDKRKSQCREQYEAFFSKPLER